jgi:stalled ribosome rescue protein Dom34
MGENSLIELVKQKLKSTHPEIVLQVMNEASLNIHLINDKALYVIVNISTGTERHKSAIIGCSDIMTLILKYMVNIIHFV